MPVSPALAESLARGVVELYAEAERALLKRIALNLDVGMEAPDWVQRKLAQLSAYRQEAEAVVAKLQAETVEGVSQALHEAYARGGSAAVADLAGLSLPVEAEVFGTHALEALVAETQGALASTHQRILRSTMDTYRSVIAETADKVLLGTQTRRQATQEALDRFAQKGITGFIDKRGRGWSLEAYTEMAMRTGTAHAAVQGQTDRLEANGMDLVIISDAPRECPLCRPAEGKVYSISGTDPKYPPLQEARDGGLFHPGCRHSASCFIPGVTQRPKGPTADPEGYEAAQKQRYLERQIRAQKRVQAAAMDPAAKAKAQAKIRGYQKQLREHAEAHDLKRLSYREQIGKGQGPAGKATLREPAKTPKPRSRPGSPTAPRFKSSKEAEAWALENLIDPEVRQHEEDLRARWAAKGYEVQRKPLVSLRGMQPDMAQQALDRIAQNQAWGVPKLRSIRTRIFRKDRGTLARIDQLGDLEINTLALGTRERLDEIRRSVGRLYSAEGRKELEDARALAEKDPRGRGLLAAIDRALKYKRELVSVEVPSLIDHEMFHFFAKGTGMSKPDRDGMRDELWKAIGATKKSKYRYTLSAYAGEQIFELEEIGAEAYAAYRLGESENLHPDMLAFFRKWIP